MTSTMAPGMFALRSVQQQQSLFVILLLRTHLQLSVWVQISISERQQRLQYYFLRQGAVCVSRAGRAVQGEQEAASDHQPFWEDVRCLVERLGNAANIIVQQPAVELTDRRVELKGTRCECVSVLLGLKQANY